MEPTAADYTTREFEEQFMLYCPEKPDRAFVRISGEGLSKLREHVWWAGGKFRIRTQAIDNNWGWVIPAEDCIAAAPLIQERYPYLEEVSEVLALGECWVSFNVCALAE